MKCLVLGASGFLGSELTRRLVDSHHQVTTLCRTPTDFLRKLEQDKKIQANYFDFFTDSRLEELVRGQDVIFHLVASHFPSGSNAEPYTDAKKNILLNAVDGTGIKVNQCQSYLHFIRWHSLR